ncbi:uncharacterized protein RAG0_12669 [Rhynchosporium agropyri]|uniref:Uncharacterized protein n=1 Tax=Rhynchosporium agropyri TaxID=914238 RepID=A0A1E1L950_9HELO|nr:uncharacterized protein RAG0_12669 [Rhynchosporium agropyri]
MAAIFCRLSVDFGFATAYPLFFKVSHNLSKDTRALFRLKETRTRESAAESLNHGKQKPSISATASTESNCGIQGGAALNYQELEEFLFHLKSSIIIDLSLTKSGSINTQQDFSPSRVKRNESGFESSLEPIQKTVAKRQRLTDGGTSHLFAKAMRT